MGNVHILYGGLKNPDEDDRSFVARMLTQRQMQQAVLVLLFSVDGKVKIIKNRYCISQVAIDGIASQVWHFVQ